MLWQIVGFVGYFEFSHYRVRKEIKKRLKEGVPSDELVHFSFSSKELNRLTWLKPHEFQLNGSLFDVVRKSTVSDTHYLECISDVQETVLFANLELLVNSDLNDHSKNPGMAYWLKIITGPSILFDEKDAYLDFVLLSFEDHVFMYRFSVISSFVDAPENPPTA